ncbi:MAG: helix-turn-helix transcriptional regulator [Prevotella sp.]|nr:helix-turn-helix transcriptional regulator [Prevotella sp.]
MIQYEITTFYIMLYAGVTFVAATACCYLIFRRGNAIAPDVTSPIRLRHWTAAFFAVIVLSHVWWFEIEFHQQDNVIGHAIAMGLDGVALLITVVGFLFSMLQDRKRSLLPVFIALIPFLAGVALCIIRNDKDLFQIPLTYFLLVFFAFIVYMAYSVRQYSYWLRDNYADLEHKEVWQSLLLLAVFFLFFTIYSNDVKDIAYQYLIQTNCLILIALLLWRVETLQQLEPVTAQEADTLNTKGAFGTTSLNVPTNIGALLKEHCEVPQLYLCHDITLDELSKAVGTNRTYLSAYFAQEDISYNAYINRLRVQHFVRLYRERTGQKQQFTAQELANESGFRSYATFGLAFKRFMGKTVSSWIKTEFQNLQFGS